MKFSICNFVACFSHSLSCASAMPEGQGSSALRKSVHMEMSHSCWLKGPSQTWHVSHEVSWHCQELPSRQSENVILSMRPSSHLWVYYYENILWSYSYEHKRFGWITGSETDLLSVSFLSSPLSHPISNGALLLAQPGTWTASPPWLWRTNS